MANNITGRFVMRRNNQFSSDFCINVIHVKTDENLPLEVIKHCKKGKGFDVTVVGYNLPTTKARYFGDWVSSKYGMQFKAVSYEYVTPDTKKGLVTFLSSKTFKGIGSSIANAIVDHFGMDALEVIKSNPEKLLVIRGLSAKKIKVLSETLKATERYNQLAVFLGQYGLESTKIQKIARSLGIDPIKKIKANPYIITEVEGIGFKTADDVAKVMIQEMTTEEAKDILGTYYRIRVATISSLKELSNLSGDTYTEYKDIYSRMYQVLNSGLSFEVVSKENLSGAFKKMFKEGDIVGFCINGRNCVLDADANKAEKEVACRIKELLHSPISEDEITEYRTAADSIFSHSSIPFSDDQKLAISLVLNSRVSILNGGPGTGKSTCLRAIVEIYRKTHGVRTNIVQVAPTGKAARRMTESTGIPSDTIHRACGVYTSYDLKKEGSNTFETGLIICDEVSMVDSALMRCLLNSVNNASQIVLVGDSDQLPSVGAGAVLRDLMLSNIVPVYRLTENHRQSTDAGIIIENARKINRGNSDLEWKKNVFEFVSAYSEEDGLNKLLGVYRQECERVGQDNVVILCPRRRNALVSVETLNKQLQNIVNPRFNGDLCVKVGVVEYRIRDKVIQLKNTERASNGDVGTITNIVSDKDTGDVSVMIHFEDGVDVEYSLEEMNNVDLAYALTIHKSQGDEYTSVIMPIMSSQECPLFQRALLFTGVTRASKKCTIIGDINAINYCIKNNVANNRKTLLKERLEVKHV